MDYSSDLRTRTASNSTLTDAAVADAFHSYLKSSLAQARAERLIDADMLATAEADQLMITGPALCLYFAALRCTTNPPSVPLPRPRKAQRDDSGPPPAPVDLSFENCPPQFTSFLRVWAGTVPAIQSLAPEAQHDLARIICGLQPINHTASDTVRGLAEDMRAVAIEISQRRSFQDRYAEDLQAAIDAANGISGSSENGGKPRVQHTSFVPPPAYDSAVGGSSGAGPSSAGPSGTQQLSPPATPTTSSPQHLSPPTTTQHLPPTTSQHLSPPATPTASTSASGRRSRTPSPSMLVPEATATLMAIRETLYACILDVLSPSNGPDGSNKAFLDRLRTTFREDPAKAYYTTVALAILHFARFGVVAESGRITGVLGTEITLDTCPRALRPLMTALVHIARTAKAFEEEDDERMAIALSEGREEAEANDGETIKLGSTRLERVRKMLEGGVGWAYEEEEGASRDDAPRGRARAPPTPPKDAPPLPARHSQDDASSYPTTSGAPPTPPKDKTSFSRRDASGRGIGSSFTALFKPETAKEAAKDMMRGSLGRSGTAGSGRASLEGRSSLESRHSTDSANNCHSSYVPQSSYAPQPMSGRSTSDAPHQTSPRNSADGHQSTTAAYAALRNTQAFPSTEPLHIAKNTQGARGGSPTGRTLALANAINELTLRLTSLGPFRERARAVFGVLAGL
ncbi:hypothetical protein K523DRAFT_260803 [Schizophyllum commune Tattone D]|nr:hypothetical protein K523DRAFT_260803 [Schizophyllum commune Tattone D]